MKHRKHGARLLGLLFVATIGAMAFAASAQALAPGFLINQKPVGTLLASVSAAQEGVSSMLVPGLNFELNCTAFTVDEGHIGSNTDLKFVLLQTGCTLLSISKLPEEIHCHVKEPIKTEALLLPAETIGGEPAVLAEKLKTLMVYHLPGIPLGVTPCTLPLDNVLTGEICFQILNSDKVKPLLLTNASVQCKERPALEALTEGAGTKDVTKYGAQTVTFDIAAEIFLVGAHSGMSFGVSLILISGSGKPSS